MILLNGVKVEPTKFPDGTSQVWKLPEPLSPVSVVTWEFENEGEIMHVAQLAMLLGSHGILPHLHLPFLPYGRQDKKVANDATFALRTFAQMIRSMGFVYIDTLDAHSDVFMKLTGAVSLNPKSLIIDAVKATKAKVIGLPDHGAYLRYGHYEWPFIVGKKERDQSTGQLHYEGASGTDVKDKTVLIVDDICDGGATFIQFAELLYSAGAKEIHMFTTHGIYSKGTQVLRDAGISRIFNRKGEVV